MWQLQITEIFSSLLIARWPSIKSSVWLSLNCKGVALFRGHCRNSFFGVKASAHMNKWGNIAETDQISYYVSQTKNLSGQKTNVRQYCQRKGKGRWRREEAIFVPREVIWKVGEFSLNTYFWMKYHYRVYIFCIDNSFPFFIPRFTVRFQKIIENSLVFGEKI